MANGVLAVNRLEDTEEEAAVTNAENLYRSISFFRGALNTMVLI